MSDQRNLIIAIGLSLAILLGFQFFFEAPRQERMQRLAEQQAAEQAKEASQGPDGSLIPTAPAQSGAPGAPTTGSIPGAPAMHAAPGATRNAALKRLPRVPVNGARLGGSIALKGGRIDDLTLLDYKTTIDDGSPAVTLFSPQDAPRPYFGQFGWIPIGELKVPDSKTVWQADHPSVQPSRPLTLSWDNGQGVRFIQVIEIDDNFMMTVTQRVENSSTQAISTHPYGRIARTHTPDTLGFYILHEGPLAVFNDTLKEVDYDDLQEGPADATKSTGGWIGITDKYWLAALIPDQKEPYTGTFRYSQPNKQDTYQADFMTQAPQVIAPGATAQTVSHIFVGAKEVNLLDRYEVQLGIARFDLAVDFGWFYFLTKPLFFVLDYFFKMLGNFGLAILLLTVCVKAIFFPLANKSYKSMSKMKALQPEMTKLKERHGGDRTKMNQEMMALYKKEKVNPASGCLPIMLQIPVFFALYKVMFVTIEMRHQPFFGWIHDLSAPDPMYLVTLFGAIPWDPPQFLLIGIWPVFMGISMYAQQLLNPQPADPVQAKIFLFMPLFFTFLLGSFPAGLVIYWTWNNLLSVTQQYIIMKRMGVPIKPK
ncbi:MAG: membrane protein insertase YidC [Alphaproteobacteria bacterium]|jgi:YidC/Oxa1 family membrane protein insertase|nr:membrane protein insertase YidC [Rhodospirillaceae bacterium]MDP6023903.1 membrane protein insertase YidC [Alphaproteobacteria bacterium]MDP6255211.1 membrane protein insertase YidC [Alphaproteobacteria bacterium]MDP7055174.1 membrane protein insertase YidC [Alphaproteobacteria bacterium]MDP7228022.1 membrane protein insertase YidC [Alphaproteobacteria bacterium]